jgi:hypothetical protein
MFQLRRSTTLSKRGTKNLKRVKMATKLKLIKLKSKWKNGKANMTNWLKNLQRNRKSGGTERKNI